MLGGIASVILLICIIIFIPEWINGITKWDGKCEPSEECEKCPFPCENHEKKRRDKK